MGRAERHTELERHNPAEAASSAALRRDRPLDGCERDKVAMPADAEHRHGGY